MIRSAVILLAELAALFVGVAAGVHLLQRRLGPERLRAWMGGRPAMAALKGIAVGFVTPFCTFSAIPMLVGLRTAGVPPAGYVAFVAAAPVLDPVLFGALVLIIGPEVAFAYVGVAFVAAMAIALVAQSVGIDRHLTPVSELVGATGPEACGFDDDAPAWQGIRAEIGPALGMAARLARSFGPLLVLGVGIGLAIEALVSPDAVASIAGDGNAAIPVAAALGVPLYFNTELFVPIADALHLAGVSVGAIVALTIAGAGANVPEFVILSRLARPRVITVFFAYVFMVAMAGGALAQVIAA